MMKSAKKWRRQKSRDAKTRNAASADTPPTPKMNSRRLIDLPSIAEAYPRSLDCPADIEGLTPEKPQGETAYSPRFPKWVNCAIQKFERLFEQRCIRSELNEGNPPGHREADEDDF
jgi:hypothetical protein